jgi:cytochrome c553
VYNNLKFKKVFLILTLGVFFSSCLTNVDELEELDPCETITFSENVKSIIEANCVQCHGSGGNVPNLTTYSGISANASFVKAETSSRRMPQGGSLTNDEIAAIACWVDAGALNN